MPIYEYKCSKCGRFEVVQKVADEPLCARPGCTESDCPKNAQRLISKAAFHLKGSGWYKTDYGSGGASSSTSSDSKSESKPGSKDGDSAKSDGAASSGSTEPAKKTETKGGGGEGGGSGGGCGSGCGCH